MWETRKEEEKTNKNFDKHLNAFLRNALISYTCIYKHLFICIMICFNLSIYQIHALYTHVYMV